jgi:hypothetical protein
MKDRLTPNSYGVLSYWQLDVTDTRVQQHSEDTWQCGIVKDFIDHPLGVT